MTSPVRLLEERPFNPPRAVEVLHEGSWWPGVQQAWRLCDDGRGWMADVEFVARYDWGNGKHVMSVTADRIRLPDGQGAGNALTVEGPR